MDRVFSIASHKRGGALRGPSLRTGPSQPSRPDESGRFQPVVKLAPPQQVSRHGHFLPHGATTTEQYPGLVRERMCGQRQRGLLLLVADGDASISLLPRNRRQARTACYRIGPEMQ